MADLLPSREASSACGNQRGKALAAAQLGWRGYGAHELARLRSRPGLTSPRHAAPDTGKVIPPYIELALWRNCLASRRRTLAVLAVLVSAREDLHGFAIAQQAGRPTGSIYPILDRLRRIGWLTSYWETEHPQEGRPRRRFYQLEPDGLQAARALLAERRTANPAVLRRLRGATNTGA